MCTGKVYYDLLEARAAKKSSAKNVSIMRIEQLYPLSTDEVMLSLEGLPEGTDVVWVQEEPTNMGAWPYLKLNFVDEMRSKYKVQPSEPCRIRQPQHRIDGRAQARASGAHGRSFWRARIAFEGQTSSLSWGDSLGCLQLFCLRFKICHFRFEIFQFRRIIGLLSRTRQTRAKGLQLLVDNVESFLSFFVHGFVSLMG